MIESMEIRVVTNGYILVVHTEDESKEYIYSTLKQLQSAVKSFLTNN